MSATVAHTLETYEMTTSYTPIFQHPEGTPHEGGTSRKPFWTGRPRSLESVDASTCPTYWRHTHESLRHAGSRKKQDSPHPRFARC
jgi:hypothetical protein